MKNCLSFYIISSFLLTGVLACSGGGGGGGTNNGAPGPQSKEEALQRLSDSHRAIFNAWQSKVVKSCDSAQAFGIERGNRIERDGIDGVALIKKNNGSIIFSDGKTLAILTNYNSMSGIGRSTC